MLVDDEGRVRVADFGLAAAQGMDRLTRTGAMVGTPSHMAPEQFEGRRDDVGSATDVWALGATLLELCTLKTPFAGGP